MRVNDLSRLELMFECLAKRTAFLKQANPWSLTLSTVYHSGILYLQKFWQQFGGQLKYGAHQR